MDFSETLRVFENIHRLAENVIAANMLQQQPEQQQQPQQQQQPRQQQERPQPNQMENVMEAEFIEVVRYEATSARQVQYLDHDRDDILNIRLERRVRIVTEGEPDMHGYRAVIYFTPTPN